MVPCPSARFLPPNRLRARSRAEARLRRNGGEVERTLILELSHRARTARADEDLDFLRDDGRIVRDVLFVAHHQLQGMFTRR